MRLYEITDEILSALADVEGADGELTDEMEAKLDALDIALEEKVERIGLFIEDLELEAEKVEKEEKRLFYRRKAFERRARWLKNYLMRCLLAVGKRSVKTTLVTFSVQKN
jgi:DNA repair ATPase RecN